MDVNNEGGRLVINSKNETVMPSVTLDISNLPSKLVKGFLVGTYQRGYDKINILFGNEKQFIPIQRKMSEFLGFEIMERTDKGCVIQSIAKNLDIDFQMSLRKAFLIVKDVIDTMYSAFEKGDKEKLKRLRYKDFDVNRFCYFCLRNINKQTYVGIKSQEIYVLYYLIVVLEDLGDTCSIVSRILSRIDKDKEIIFILKQISKYFGLVYEFFYKPDQDKMINALKMDQEILKLIRNATKDAIKNRKLQKIYTLYLLHDIAQLVYHFPSRRMIDMLKG